MKIKTTLAIGVISLFFLLPSCFGQGALAPPGAPAPTMKSLDQIEVRTPISSAPFNITQPGSYYLTTNLTVSGGNAITIATSGVTLDLSGFTITSTAASASGYGILIDSGLRDITIANGFIQGGVTNNGSGVYGGSGFGYGIYYSGSAPVNVLVSRVSVSGCLDYGIWLGDGDSTVVESCSVRTIGSYGIVASTIKQSLAIGCGNLGIDGDQVFESRGQSGGNGYGVYANYTARDCYGSSSSGFAVSASITQNCYGYNNHGGYGVYATVALNCEGFSYGSSNAYGVYATSAENCYGENDSGGYGVFAINIANECSGYSYSGTGVYAFIANVCHGTTQVGTALNTSHNVNSF